MSQKFDRLFLFSYLSLLIYKLIVLYTAKQVQKTHAGKNIKIILLVHCSHPL